MSRAWIHENRHIAQLDATVRQIANAPVYDAPSGARSALQAGANVYRWWRYGRKRLREDEAIPEQARVQLLREMDNLAASAVDVLNRNAEEYHAMWLDSFNPPTTPKDTRAELAHARVWGRLQRQLDAGIQPDTLIARADRDELAVLSEELPSIVMANLHGDPAALKAAVLALADSLDSRRREIATPQEAKAFEQMDQIRAGQNRTKVGLVHLKYAIEQGDEEFPGIPSWGSDDLIDLAPIKDE